MSAEARKTITMVHWNGRFGNRMASVAYGIMYSQLFDLDFYLPSEWEGSVLFKEANWKIIEDDELRLHINQTQKSMDNLPYRLQAVDNYCRRTGKQITYFNPDDPKDFGRTDVCYDSLCVSSNHIFGHYSKQSMLKWFEWSDEVKSLDIYKKFEDIQGTYDIAHLRRDDISSPSYNRINHQAYSVISKESYLKAFSKFDIDPQSMQWSTDDMTGRWIKTDNVFRAGWTYPIGSHRVPEIIFDWLPDFLRLYFARNLFRSNSSFSWWAAFLSPTAKVYSPILQERKIYFNENDEIDCEFVLGNHPHWLHLSSDECNQIIIGD